MEKDYLSKYKFQTSNKHICISITEDGDFRLFKQKPLCPNGSLKHGNILRAVPNRREIYLKQGIQPSWLFKTVLKCFTFCVSVSRPCSAWRFCVFPTWFWRVHDVMWRRSGIMWQARTYGCRKERISGDMDKVATMTIADFDAADLGCTVVRKPRYWKRYHVMSFLINAIKSIAFKKNLL